MKRRGNIFVKKSKSKSRLKKEGKKRLALICINPESI